MSGGRTIELCHFEPPDKMLTLNERLHWAAKAKRVAEWRKRAGYAALELAPRRKMCGIMRPRCIVTVELPFKQNRHRDPHNYIATVKPIIDGLVDAGIWPNDTPEWVATTEPLLNVGGRYVIVRVTHASDDLEAAS